LKQFSGHQGSVYGVAFSPDGALLVSCGADGTIRLWDVISGQQLKQILAADKGVYSVDFDKDGRRVVAAGLDKMIRIYDTFTGALQTSIEGHDDLIYRVAFNSRGDRLLSCGYGGNVIVWNPATGQSLFKTQVGRVANDADLAPDGARVVVAGGNGIAHLVDLPAAAR
jgi:WD40 repeat protein